MEKGQSEVTNKIRSAIKKKLAEISDFVDDELPEYIMILVANQRSKPQIEKDLSLFLRNDTVNFTNWLWDLLNNLKVSTKNSQSSVSKNESVAKNDVEADEDAVILDFDPDEQGTDFLSHEDTNDSILSKSSVRPSPLQVNEVKEPPATKSIQNSKLIEKDKTEPKTPIKIRKNVSNQSPKEPLSSAVIPVKRKISAVEDEYDPTKPEYKKSFSSVSPRKYGGAAAFQANKLLLKAVDDANKSSADRLEDFYKPTPIKVLTSKQFSNPSPSKNDNIHTKRILLHKAVLQPNLIPDASEFEINDYPPDIVMEEDVSNYQIAGKSRTICTNSLLPISSSSELENVEYVEKNNYPYSFTALEEERPKSPHFIVTLDGVNRISFKRKFDDSVDSIEEEEEDYDDSEKEEEEEPLPNETVLSPEKKLKLNERCKYWPACKHSDQCSYHHPTVACKCFPDCKFGDKCLYIHPNCKFDALCSRKDCPFTHASKRKLPFVAVPVKMLPVKNRKTKVVCKFYPKCTSKNCPFVHPKLCRYGTDCRLPACLFGHFPIPSRSQMKWHANV